MNNYDRLKKYSEKLFLEHKIVLLANQKIEIIEQSALFLDSVIFNIVSLFCVLAIINHTKKITQPTISLGQKYIEQKCKFHYMHGGERLGSASFLGIQEPAYKAQNLSPDILKVDFDQGIARPEMAQTGGAPNKVIYSCMNSILKYHNLKAKKDIKYKIISFIDHHIKCFFKCLKGYKKPIRKSMIKCVIKKHHVLHALK